MNKVKAGLRGLSATAKAALGRVVLGKLQGNPNFPGMDTMLAELDAATKALSDAILEAMDGGRRVHTLKRIAVQDFDRTIARIAAHVNSVAAGDPVKLISTGFDLAKRPEPINALVAPRSKGFRFTQEVNRMEWRWTRVPGALVYRVEVSTTGNIEDPQWTLFEITSKPKARVQRHTGGELNRYRVCAIGSKLQGPFCAVAQPVAA